MFTRSFWRRNWWKLALAVVVLSPLAFTLWANGLFPPSLMRIENVGPSDLQDLTAIFPNRRVEFGDVPAGQISGYRLVFGGVYHDASYEGTVDGERIHNPVVDWVGELPLLPGSYIYVISWEPSTRPWVELLEIR